MMIKSSRTIKQIVLTTKNDSAGNSQQEDRFEELTEALGKRNITFIVKFSTALHDREIKLSNGWIIKIGRGLDYFRPPEAFMKISKSAICKAILFSQLFIHHLQ